MATGATKEYHDINFELL
ncbi:Protein of unknown function [Bacillus mycoides]|nr:Protein of unknown function [Bacillus mycoides]